MLRIAVRMVMINLSDYLIHIYIYTKQIVEILSRNLIFMRNTAVMWLNYLVKKILLGI